MMAGIPLIESMILRKTYLTHCSIDNDRIPNPFAGPDYVQVMKWFLCKVLR